VLPRIGPFALYRLLFTIVVLFALLGHTITARPGDVARIAVPLLAYFAIMWAGPMALDRVLGLGCARSATLAFTAAWQQLRAGDRRRDRGLRGHLRPGAGRGRGAAHRGPRAGRPGSRQPLGPHVLSFPGHQAGACRVHAKTDIRIASSAETRQTKNLADEVQEFVWSQRLRSIRP
jgi:hypothetical protein